MAVKKVTILASCIAVFAAHSGQVFAQDSENFSGFYVGIEGGSVYQVSSITVDAAPANAQGSKLYQGVFVGFRQQLDYQIVVGLEGQYTFPSGNLTRPNLADGTTFNYDIGSQWGGKLIVGRLFGDSRNAMLYGYFAQTSTKYDITLVRPTTTVVTTDSQSLSRFGLGMEFLFQSDWSLRGEAGYSAGGPTGTSNKVDVKVGFSYQF